jgi:hypothetical protein
MGNSIYHPELPDLVAVFLFQQRNPGIEEIPHPSKCPQVIDRGYVYTSAVATFHASTELSGANGIYHQHIYASPLWRNGPPYYDCVFAEKDSSLPGFCGLFVGQVLLFYFIHFLIIMCFIHMLLCNGLFQLVMNLARTQAYRWLNQSMMMMVTG